LHVNPRFLSGSDHFLLLSVNGIEILYSYWLHFVSGIDTNVQSSLYTEVININGKSFETIIL